MTVQRVTRPPPAVTQLVGLFVALIGSLFLGAFAMAETDGKPLAGYRWQKRVLLVFADGGGSTELERQREALAAASDGVRDRDLVIVAAVGDVVEVDGALSVDLRPDQLRRAYDVPSGRFQVLLIGKDGGVKLRSTEPVPVDRLFGTIDAMPMRRREMQARGAPS